MTLVRRKENVAGKRHGCCRFESPLACSRFETTAKCGETFSATNDNAQKELCGAITVTSPERVIGLKTMFCRNHLRAWQGSTRRFWIRCVMSCAAATRLSGPDPVRLSLPSWNCGSCHHHDVFATMHIIGCIHHPVCVVSKVICRCVLLYNTTIVLLRDIVACL